MWIRAEFPDEWVKRAEKLYKDFPAMKLPNEITKEEEKLGWYFANLLLDCEPIIDIIDDRIEWCEKEEQGKLEEGEETFSLFLEKKSH